MSYNYGTTEFNKRHPWPSFNNINSLYRFSKIDSDNTSYIEELFLNKKLYHALPSQFNDPFECKPHFNWPSDPTKVIGIRKRLIRVARDRGCSKKEAERIVSVNMKKPNYVNQIIYDSIQRTFGEMRICCFTHRKDNLLFWAHYADSHRGFCIEYDATIAPVKFAFRVLYSDEYPEVEYPRPENEDGLAPAFIKSRVWEYEEEYRTLYMPSSNENPMTPGDRQSFILSEKSITKIYFGVNMSDTKKIKLKNIVEKSDFKPEYYQAKLSSSSFKLEFFSESQ